MAMMLLGQVETATVNDRLFQSLDLMLVGMAVVVAALVALWVAIALVNRLAARQTQAAAPVERESAPGPAPAPAPVATEPAEPETDPHLIAVLTAAATCALHRPVRVSRVHFVGREDQTWAREGRRDVMSRHHPHLHRHSH